MDKCANRKNFYIVLYLSVRATLKINQRVVDEAWKFTLCIICFLTAFFWRILLISHFQLTLGLLQVPPLRMVCSCMPPQLTLLRKCFHLFLERFSSSAFRKGLAHNFLLPKIAIFGQLWWTPAAKEIGVSMCWVPRKSPLSWQLKSQSKSRKSTKEVPSLLLYLQVGGVNGH